MTSLRKEAVFPGDWKGAPEQPSVWVKRRDRRLIKGRTWQITVDSYGIWCVVPWHKVYGRTLTEAIAALEHWCRANRGMTHEFRPQLDHHLDCASKNYNGDRVCDCDFQAIWSAIQVILLERTLVLA